ncbi:hypothetical protein, partial [Mesorhizobium sp.]|uniref:hypothetical protein n=1 Tax=Mesorhizobium sp. TaxID=1871066 RepID=UPI0025D01961
AVERHQQSLFGPGQIGFFRGHQRLRLEIGVYLGVGFEKASFGWWQSTGGPIFAVKEILPWEILP